MYVDYCMQVAGCGLRLCYLYHASGRLDADCGFRTHHIIANFGIVKPYFCILYLPDNKSILNLNKSIQGNAESLANCMPYDSAAGYNFTIYNLHLQFIIDIIISTVFFKQSSCMSNIR